MSFWDSLAYIQVPPSNEDGQDRAAATSSAISVKIDSNADFSRTRLSSAEGVWRGAVVWPRETPAENLGSAD